MLFLHETHKVVGTRADEFEAAYREGWMPTLARQDDARLLWYADHAQGSGPSYTVVTITAIRDGAAWENLALRVQHGDLQKWIRGLDELRHEVEAKLLVPLPWSPLQDASFDEVPVDGREHGAFPQPVSDADRRGRDFHRVGADRRQRRGADG